MAVTPPVIRSATIAVSPDGVATASVVWDGEPRGDATFQWKNGARTLAGATGTSFLIRPDTPDLNCVVFVDNGVGAASAVALYLPAGAIPPDPGDPDPDPDPGDPTPTGNTVYLDDVYEDGVFA